MLNRNHQNLCNKNKFQSFSVCFLRDAILVTVLFVLEVIINMQNEINGVKKDTNCIRADIEYMEGGINKKIDQNMEWMKEHFTQVMKSPSANPDTPATGEFCIFGFCFNLNLVISVTRSQNKCCTQDITSEHDIVGI